MTSSAVEGGGRQGAPSSESSNHLGVGGRLGGLSPPSLSFDSDSDFDFAFDFDFDFSACWRNHSSSPSCVEGWGGGHHDY